MHTRHPVAGWRLPADLVARLAEVAERNHRSTTQEARVAIEQYLEREAGEPSPGHSVKVKGEK